MELSDLEKEFLQDHQRTTKALKDLKDVLRLKNDQSVQLAAAELDQIAGPHIAFEEKWLYPLVAKSRGKPYMEELIGEHHQVLQALSEIRSCDTSAVSDEIRSEWDRQLQTGLDHVVTCGTLLSHVTILDKDAQHDMLERLLDLRKQRLLWTQLPRPE